jgi:hypothetical protein
MGGVQDVLRAFVNVQRASASSAEEGTRSTARRDDLGLNLGDTAFDWMRDPLMSILGSVLNLSVSERGQASFSILGVGDFSVNVSGDRSEITFTSGDDVLLTAHHRRPQESSIDHRTFAAAGTLHPAAAGSAASLPGVEISAGSPIRKLLAVVVEIATHPLTMMVYAVAGCYLLLWIVLSARRRRRRVRVRTARRTSRLRSHEPAESLERARKRVRKRIRMRVRIRRGSQRAKPSSQRS